METKTERDFELIQTSSAAEIAAARALFTEYGASLGFSLCFQSFEQELASLPGKYAPPAGRLLLARSANGNFLGCVALRPLDNRTCEMKRLFTRPEARGAGVGKALVDAIIAAAREIGYARMRLDTVPSVMGSAVKMYRGLGFREIPPYTENPVAGAIFMELEL
jgi:ribosomal protein S18 acetylase RimI-like enzyme